MVEQLSEEMMEDQPFSFEELESKDWRGIMDRFSYDMDPWNVDIVKLSKRFRKYLEKMERWNLEIPARMVLVCALLLRMKTDLVRGHEERDDKEDFEEEEFEEEFIEDMEEEEEPLEIPDEPVKPKVRKKARRRVDLEELKEALGKALNIQKRRRKRRETRAETQETFIDLNEKDITAKLDQLMDRLEGFFDDIGENVPFEKILERRDKEEKLEKFTHILHLETDEKIVCQQEEFFGDIKISPKENS